MVTGRKNNILILILIIIALAYGFKKNKEKYNIEAEFIDYKGVFVSIILTPNSNNKLFELKEYNIIIPIQSSFETYDLKPFRDFNGGVIKKNKSLEGVLGVENSFNVDHFQLDSTSSILNNSLISYNYIVPHNGPDNISFFKMYFPFYYIENSNDDEIKILYKVDGRFIKYIDISNNKQEVFFAYSSINKVSHLEEEDIEFLDVKKCNFIIPIKILKKPFVDEVIIEIDQGR